METYRSNIDPKNCTISKPMDKWKGKIRLLRLSSPRLLEYTSRIGLIKSLRYCEHTTLHGQILCPTLCTNQCTGIDYIFISRQRFTHNTIIFLLVDLSKTYKWRLFQVNEMY